MIKIKNMIIIFLAYVELVLLFWLGGSRIMIKIKNMIIIFLAYVELVT